jgi:hypothetical protein
MSLSGYKGRLAASARELSLQWEETCSSWRDSKSQEFRQRYITELLAQVDRAIPAIEKLDQVLAKIRSDCE